MHGNMSLRTNLIFLLLVPAVCNADPYDEAAKKTAEAVYAKLDGQKYVEQFADKHLPKQLREFVEQWGFYGKLLIEKRVEVKWTF